MPWQLPYRHSTISTAAQPIPHTSLRLTSLMAPESGRKVQLSGLLMGTVDMTLKQTHNGTGCNTGPTYTVLFDMRKACGWKADMANWWRFWQHRWQSCRIYVFIICLNSLGSLVTEWELWIVHFNSLRHLYLSTYNSRECQGEAHEPCDCETWKLWLQKVNEMRPEECEYWQQFTYFSLWCVFYMKLHVS